MVSIEFAVTLRCQTKIRSTPFEKLEAWNMASSTKGWAENGCRAVTCDFGDSRASYIA
jgi:hypothetical protein